MTRCILFLEALPIIAGGQQVLLDALPALAGYDLHAMLPGSGPLSEALSAAGVTCHLVPMASYSLVRKNWADLARFPLDQLSLAIRCARLIRRVRADLVYANSGRVFVWGTLGAALASCPVLWHQHNLLGDAKTLALLGRLGRWRVVRRIIAVSTAAGAQFPHLTDKTSVVPTGVDTAAFRPDRAARSRLRRELGISADTLTVGIVGDLIPLKGQHTLLEAAGPGPAGVCYLVVGDARPGDDRSAVYAARLRRIAPDGVMFTGRREDIPALLNALDLLVVASERETGPLVLLESLACGTPVVSTPVGRAPELLPPEALFPVGDAAALARRIRFWLANPGRLRVAGSAARALAEERLTLERYRAHIRAEIEGCLAPEGPKP